MPSGVRVASREGKQTQPMSLLVPQHLFKYKRFMFHKMFSCQTHDKLVYIKIAVGIFIVSISHLQVEWRTEKKECASPSTQMKYYNLTPMPNKKTVQTQKSTETTLLILSILCTCYSSQSTYFDICYLLGATEGSNRLVDQYKSFWNEQVQQTG